MESQEKPIHKTHPRAMNHVGVGVSDIEKAIHWYQEILGFTLLKGPLEVHADQGYRGEEVHASRIAASGGRQRSKIWRIDSTTNEYRLCYCEDPFGNIIEIYTHNYETLYGGMKVGQSEAK